MHTSRVTRSILCVLLACAAIAPGRGSAQQPPLWDGLEAGEHDVGFRRIWELDRTRVWPRSAALDSLEGTVARPLRIDVWYPAACGKLERMPLRAYLEMSSPAPAFDDLVFLTHRWDEHSYRGLAEDSASFERLMGTETAACADARQADGRFPLVVYSAGWFNRAPDNTVLAEYLASHGFVVAAVPQLNPGLWTFSFSSDAPSVENQIRDLEAATGILSDESSVDRRRIAAMGYSTGGDVALLLQGRNPLVDAVVGLDASWTLGSDNDVSGSPFFLPAQHSVPVLAVRRDPMDLDADADEVLDALSYAPRLVVAIPGADHGTFSDDPAQRRLLGTGSAEHEATHTIMARTVLEFLEAVLKGDRTALPGAELASRFRESGLDARFFPATEPEEQ